MDFEKGSYINNIIIKNLNDKYYTSLCSGWNEYTNFKHLNINIISSLYSYNGALLLLRNILRNTKIKVLIILDNNILGQTPIGKNGLELIYNLFFNNNYEIPKELTEYNINMLQKKLNIYYIKNNIIFNNFNANILYDENIDNLINSIIANSSTYNYESRENIIVKNHNENIISINPSEYSGFQIHNNDLFSSWIDTLKYVYKFGILNKNNLHELHSIHWSFNFNKYDIIKYKQIISQKNIQLLIGLDTNMLNEYAKIINDNVVVNGSAYTYGSRLEIFKNKIITELKNNIHSRHAYATTIHYDKFDIQPPCMVYIQFLYDTYNEKLNLYVIFRSHDIFKGAFSNGYGLGILLQNYSKILNVQPGLIEITSISAHIYKEDLYDAKLLLECVDKNIIFDEYLDKKGYCVINKINNDIFECKIYDYKENKLINNLTGTNIEIYKKILEIFDNQKHLQYIFKTLFT